jgi:diamine N-acetyltransferase
MRAIVDDVRCTVVTLREITRDNVRAICKLAVAPEQEPYVSPVALSIAEAHFAPEAWFRSIHAGDEAVGFVMLSLRPEIPDYFLWRLLIDARHQGKGYGRATLDLVVDVVRGLGARELQTSAVPGPRSPEPFYVAYGFEPTGAMEEGERVLRLPIRTA